MYERSAIVLEKYLENILNIDKEYNLKTNYENFRKLVEEIEKYQLITEQETNIIQEFDNMAIKIQEIQKRQEKISKANQKLENDRIKVFSDLGENANTLENKLNKIENTINQNNEELQSLKEEFVKYLSDFSERQKERNKCEKARRIGEAKHLEYLRQINEQFKQINSKDSVTLKDFILADKNTIKEEIEEIMVGNGKNEKIKFNEDVLKKAIRVRISIAEREAEIYLLVYDKMKKLLSELENDTLKLEKYKKIEKSSSVKLSFLNAEKEYIASFLDYERMTATTGVKAHKKMMEQACNNFELDIIQIDNLYELLLKETTKKATKKAYEELYNKTYLKGIEDKEKNFEQEVNSIQVKMATVINSNYWRIEGIKNIYDVFQYEISAKYDKDLSEYRIEDQDNDEEFDDDEYEYENYEDEEFDDDEYEYENYEDEEFDDDEYEDEDYEDDEFEDDEYEEDEDYEDEEFDDDEYEDEDYEDDEFEDDEYEDEDYEDEEFDDGEYEDEDYEDDEFEDDEYEEDEDYDDEDKESSNIKNKPKKKSDKKQNNLFGKFFGEKKNKKLKK